MPKLIVSKDNFIDLDVYTQKIQTRYRVTTDDKNVTSYWSSIYSVDPMLFFTRGTVEIPGNISVEKVGSNIKVIWDSVAAYKDLSSDPVLELPYYDIWIRWADSNGTNPGQWLHVERSSSTSLDIIVPQYYTGTTTPKYIFVEIYRPGKPILRYEDTISFLQNSDTVDITNDTIEIESGYRYTTGSPVVYTSSSPITGLTSGNTYYIRVIDYYKFSLHPTESDAVLNLNKINLSGSLSGTGEIVGRPFLMYFGETNF
jgi:hypothetical protein